MTCGIMMKLLTDSSALYMRFPSIITQIRSNITKLVMMLRSKCETDISHVKLRLTCLPLHGRVWPCVSARARGFFGERSENCPVLYHTYLTTSDSMANPSPAFSFFIFVFLTSTFYLLLLYCRVLRGGGGGDVGGGRIQVASYTSSVGVHNLATRRSGRQSPIRSFADERSKFIPVGMKFRGVTNSVALSERR